MNSKLIEYLNKSRNSNKDNIKAILFSEDTFTYYYLFDINMENKKSRPSFFEEGREGVAAEREPTAARLR